MIIFGGEEGACPLLLPGCSYDATTLPRSADFTLCGQNYGSVVIHAERLVLRICSALDYIFYFSIKNY